ncbi:hypothetical protein CHS0354_038766 [Potamilus streckersoni]|uniref:Uncharacterized protein n=1 Tax=Potamilus streckersoni TaxID=2493646 RepID=A0AAE0SRC5_9BIVA|nr:hypothetical protein CHS0354_038766 [Potamilus streckersoni]
MNDNAKCMATSELEQNCLTNLEVDINEEQTVKATSAIDHTTYSNENQGTTSVAELPTADDAKSQKHPVSCDLASPEEMDWLDRRNQILASLYGQCVGDAIGLLSEFMNRQQAEYHYRRHSELEYHHKYEDFHRSRWAEGDWTDDSDQMILIMESLTENGGLVVKTDFAQKMVNWMKQGFQDLGDLGGMGIGSTTLHTLRHKDFLKDPHKVAEEVWIFGKKDVAPNGGVMRTSILGIHDWWNTDQVVRNALEICKTTHRDPRCQASAVSVCVAISLMLQRAHYTNGEYNVPDLIKSVYKYAKKCLDSRKKKKNLKSYLECKELSELELDEAHSLGYTYKCLGAGFWALKQNNFRDALQQIVMHAGDADTNGAVAGALLGCKLGHFDEIPNTWLSKLKHKDWLDGKIEKYFEILKRRYMTKDAHVKDTK